MLRQIERWWMSPARFVWMNRPSFLGCDEKTPTALYNRTGLETWPRCVPDIGLLPVCKYRVCIIAQPQFVGASRAFFVVLVKEGLRAERLWKERFRGKRASSDDFR